LTLLKIDRVFTSRLPSDRRSCTLVSTIIGLAHAFDMTTVAEGVETQAQLDYLVREGCDESQGYLHSRPLPDRIWRAGSSCRQRRNGRERSQEARVPEPGMHNFPHVRLSSG